MSLAIVYSRAQVGVEAPAVTVEVHLANGLPALTLVGLPETAVKESKDRVRSAILNSGFDFPARRITLNLAPADLPKDGGRFDLAIALGILAASGQMPAAALEQVECLGEGFCSISASVDYLRSHTNRAFFQPHWWLVRRVVLWLCRWPMQKKPAWLQV